MSRVVAFVRRQGGFCTRAEVLDATSRHEVDDALSCGQIVWISRGRYGLPDLDRAIATAHGLRGVLSHLSAAAWHGWEVKTPPEHTHVTLPRRRHLGTAPPVHLHRADLRPDEVDGISTSVRRTLADCLRSLPFDEALAVADSALRHGVAPEDLDAVAANTHGPGRAGVVRAARHADGRAANPFESCLRAIAIVVEGLDVSPQVLIRGSRRRARPDLVDEALKIVVEADSFAWHGGREELVRDTRRYNDLAVDGWLVLRFSYEDVMFRPDEVAEVLRAAVDARTQVRPGARIV
ncbi:MAG: hypothetical protein JWR20_2216 [Marmoricola sp.]|nr:hypothetical protein [Marmoricola sp.]